MSLLNMPSDGMPNVLLVLYRYLLAAGPTPRQKLLDMCAPAVVCEPKLGEDGRSGTRAWKTVNTWCKLGLFVEDEARVVSLAPDAPDEESGLFNRLREIVFRPQNNDPFWGSEGVLAADFTRGLAWCLAMDPIRLHGGGFKAVDELELNTLPREVEVFRNDTRWNGFKAWSMFLGFAWQAKYPKKHTLVVDPAPAIRDLLPDLFFGTVGELTQRDFLIRLREQMPFLDGGTYRLAVEERLLPERWVRPKDGELSASLSLALLRLKFEGELEFRDLADPAAGRVTLTGRNGRQIESVSHFYRKGVGS